MRANKQGILSIESKNIFTILKRWLYSEQDIVFRELVSNAIDATEKLQTVRPGSVGQVLVHIDAEKQQLVISDNGIGMSAEEVDKYINQIAFSGAEDFVRQHAQANSNIIGHFGVGFYSAFMLADHVSIETKSVTGAPAVRWDCTADMSFTMNEGQREQNGTDIILHLPQQSPYLADPQLAFEAIKKYFIFAKTPVYFRAPGYDHVGINTTKPVWQQAPEHLSTGDMENFYQDFFNDSHPPLFWFQFSSVDLGLRGVLYFRNTKNGSDELDGTIKVYCRGVYVGENIKGLIPKFINLQNGIIECDQLPLVVSRGELHGGGQQQPDSIIDLVNECLIQEVAIALNNLFTNRRDEYEAYWPEINAFVKYGVLQDKIFASVMTRKVIFEDIYGKYHTLSEYTQGGDRLETVCYASDKLDQAHYIEILRKLGQNALLFDHVIDQPLLFKYETVYPQLQFIRIDSNSVAVYHGSLLAQDDALANTLRKTLEQALGNRLGAVEIQFTRMASAEVSALIVNDEQARRVTDMMEIYGMINSDDMAERGKQSQSALLLNLNNDIVQFLCSATDEAMLDSVANQLFDLALMSQQMLKPQDMESFVSRSEGLLKAYIGTALTEMP